jgi:hypothetical protein
MRSASFFLLSIIEFLREKTIQHGSLGFYMINVSNNTHDALEFLDKVVMPRHQYQITKEKFMQSSESDRSVYEKSALALVIIRWFVVALVSIAVLIYMGVDLLLNKIRPETFPNTIQKTPSQRVIIVIALCAAGVSAYFISEIFVQFYYGARDDAYGRKDIVYDGEQFFEQFENIDAIALYYGLSRTFKDKDNPTMNSESIWKSYKTITNNGEDVVQIQEVVAENSMLGENKDIAWKTVVGKCTPIYIGEVENKVRSNPKVYVKEHDARTELELQKLSEVEEQIKCWDIHYLRRELQIRATYLYQIVARSSENALPEMKLSEIVNIYVAPKFKFGDVLVLEDIGLKDPDALKVIVKKGVNSPSECLYETNTRKDCVMGTYSNGVKKCILFSQLPPKGCVFKREEGSYVYIRSFDDQVVFLEGESSAITTTSPTTTEDPRQECLDNADCKAVRVGAILSQTSGIGISEEPNKIKDVTPCSVGKQCTLLKFNLVEMGKKMDVYTYLNKVEPSLRKWFLKLAEGYQNTLYFTTMLDLLNNELALHYNENQVDLIMNRATEIFEDIDQVIKKKGMLSNYKFTSKMRFIDKFNEYTIEDFNEIKTNVVQKLFTFLTILRNRFTWEMAKKASLDENSLLAEVRAIARTKNLLIITVTVLGAFIICYGIRLVMDDQQSTISKLGKSSFAFAVVCIAISMMYAIYQKRKVSFEYNRDMLEMNSAKLINSVLIVKQLCETIDKDINDRESPNITLRKFNIPEENKIEMHTDIINTIRLLEKCNLLTLDLDKDLPFPVMEIAMNIGVIFVLLVVLVIVVNDLKSSEIAHQISSAHTIIQKVKDYPRRFTKTDFPELFCETHATGTLIIMGAALAVITGIYISQNLIKYGSKYRIGLYNSKYYEDGRCVKK